MKENKNIVYIVIALVVGLVIGFFIGKSAVKNTTSTKSNSTIATSDSKEENSQKKEPINKNLGDKIETDDILMTLSSVDFKDKIEWSTGSYSTRTISIDPDKVALTLNGTIKNLRGNAIDSSSFVGKIIIDDKYNYDLSFESHSSSMYQIQPLEETEYDFYAQVPQEIKDSYSKVKIIFGFMNDFSYPTTTYYVNGTKSDITDNLDNVYSIDLTK